MNTRANQILRKFLTLFFAFLMMGVIVFQSQAATLSPQLNKQLNTLGNDANVGMVIVSFNTNNGLIACVIFHSE